MAPTAISTGSSAEMRLLVALIIGAPLIITAQNPLPRFEFRGRVLGDSISTSGHPGVCSRRDVRQQSSCHELDVSIGEVTVDITYDYLHGRLFRVWLAYPPNRFDELTRVLAAKYGAPQTRAKRFVTIGGVRTPNPIYAWRFREGPLEVKKYGYPSARGNGSIATMKGLSELSRLRKAAAHRAALRELGTRGSHANRIELSRVESDTSHVNHPYFEFEVEEQAHMAAGSPQPRYPDMLKSANIVGDVAVQFVVDSAGRAEMETFRVLKSTHEGFTAAVRSALPEMLFTPARTGGRKVRQLVYYPFTFGK